MPQDAQAATGTPDEPTPQERWATAFNAWMAQKGLRNRDAVRLTGYPSDRITAWSQGRSGVTIEAALQVAKGFALSPVEVLRAGGHDDVAQLIDDIAHGRRAANPDDDQVTARAREYTRGLPSAMAESITKDLAADVARAYEYARLKAEESRRRIQDDGDDIGA